MCSVYTCFVSTRGCHALAKMSWKIRRKRLPGQLFKITGQLYKAFCLHREPCAWSTAHVGGLVSTQKKNKLPFLGKGHFHPLFKTTYNLVQPWTPTWTSIQLTPSQLVSKYILQYYLHICICVSKAILTLHASQLWYFFSLFWSKLLYTPTIPFSVIWRLRT